MSGDFFDRLAELHASHDCDPGPCTCACGCQRPLGCRESLGPYCSMCHLGIVYGNLPHDYPPEAGSGPT